MTGIVGGLAAWCIAIAVTFYLLTEFARVIRDEGASSYQKMLSIFGSIIGWLVIALVVSMVFGVIREGARFADDLRSPPASTTDRPQR